MKILLVVTVIFISTNCIAKDYFFRPQEGGPYGNSNGTSYANAWHLDDTSQKKGHVDWSVISPGDTLYVCGTHDSGYRDKMLTPVSSITIDGACPKDPGTLFHAGYKIDKFGKPDNFGAYAIKLGGNTSGQLIENRATRLKKAGRKPDKNWPAGSFYHDTTEKTLYYKPTTEPVDKHVIYTSDGQSAIRIINATNVTVQNITIMNVMTGNGAIMIVDSPRTTINNVVIRWAGDKAIYGRNSSHAKITNNVISDVANGIYFVDLKSYLSSHLLISGNEIFNVDQDVYYAHDDAHAIGIQGGHDTIISHNYIHDIGGSGITLFTFSKQPIYNYTIEHNVVNNVYSTKKTKRVERGIEIGGFNDMAPEMIYGNIVRYNKVSNVKKECFRSKSVRSTKGVGWKFISNETYNCGSSFAWSEAASGDPAFVAENNIFNNAKIHIDQQQYDMHKDHSGIIMKNNKYLGDGKYTWNGKSYSTLSVWKHFSGLESEGL